MLQKLLYSMKTLLSLLFCLLFFRNSGLGQKTERELIDSLVVVLAASKADTTRLNLYAEIIYRHVNYQPKEGLVYVQPALDLAKKTNWNPGTARIKNRVGRLYWRLGNFNEALQQHFEAFNIYTKDGDKIGEGRILLAIGQDYLDKGDYGEARTNLLKAIAVTGENGDRIYQADTYAILNYLYTKQGDIANATEAAYAYLKAMEISGTRAEIAMAASTLGDNYYALGKTTEALKYYKISLQGAIEGGMMIEEITYSTVIGDICAEVGKYTDALEYYTAALKSAVNAKDDKLLADIHHGLGNLNRLLGNYQAALQNFKHAETEYKSVGNQADLAKLYTNSGKVYTALKQYNLATKNFALAKELYDSLDNKLSRIEYYNGLEQLNIATGNWKSAYNNFKNYSALKDSSFNKETVQKLVVAQMQYAAEKKDAIVKAEQEKKDLIARTAYNRQRNIRNAAIAVLTMVLIFSVIVFRQRNKIAMEKRRSDLLLADKELLLREIHHRVKNNLEVVSSLLALQSAQVDDPNTRELMQEGQNRVHSIGIVHQKLYQGENLGAIEMKDYFINLSESILDSFGANEKVQIECAMDALDIDIDTAVPLGLIVNELLTNTLKYAFPDGRVGKVQIRLEKRKDGILQLQVTDNGVGKSGITRGTGFGGQLVSLLTKQLSGSMREEINNGTSIIFEFKMDAAA